MNNLRKENQQFQEDIKTAKRGEEKAKKRLEDCVNSYIKPFCNNLCKILEIPGVQFDLKNGIGLPLAKGSKSIQETQIEAYLKALLKGVQEREKMTKSFAEINNLSALDNKANISSITGDGNEIRHASTFNLTTNHESVSNLDQSQSSMQSSVLGSKLFRSQQKSSKLNLTKENKRDRQGQGQFKNFTNNKKQL